MKHSFVIIIGFVACLFLLLIYDPIEEYSRWRKRTISNEYRACIERSANVPSNEHHLRKVLTVYRQRSKSDPWARAEFWGQLTHYLPSYKSSKEGSRLLQHLLIEELRSAINDKDEDVRFQAVSIAGRMGKLAATVVPDLVHVMKKHPTEGSGLLAIRALGEIGPAAVAALPELRKLEETNDDARKAISLIEKAAKE